jgi:hypothetical protein
MHYNLKIIHKYMLYAKKQGCLTLKRMDTYKYCALNCGERMKFEVLVFKHNII